MLSQELEETKALYQALQHVSLLLRHINLTILQRSKEREEIDAHIAKIIESIIQDNLQTGPANLQNDDHRLTLQKMVWLCLMLTLLLQVYTAIGGISRKDLGAGPNPVAVLSDILQQIFSEYDVLVIENRALHEFQEQHRDAEYIQWKLEEVKLLLLIFSFCSELGNPTQPAA